MPLRIRIICLAALVFSQGFGQAPFLATRPSLSRQSVSEGLPSATVHDLALDSKGRLWAGTTAGPAYHTGASWVTLTMPPEAEVNFIRCLQETSDGSFWFGTQGAGLWQYSGGKWIRHGANMGLPAERVNCLLEVAESGTKELWAGTRSEGVARFRGGTWSVLGVDSGLPDPSVWKLRLIREADGQRRIWAATARGLARWTGERWQPIGPTEGFLGQHANDILEVDEGGGARAVWVSCWNLGVARWDGRRWTHYRVSDGFPSLNPTCLAATKDAKGRPVLWAGTYEGGLIRFEDGIWRTLRPEDGFPSAGVHALLASLEGKPTLWAASRGSGVLSIDMGGWRTLDQGLGLPNPEVTSFAEEKGPNGTFWIGTRRGLVGFQGGRRLEEKGLPNGYVFSLLATRESDGRSRLWAATLGGLALKENGRWRMMGAAEGFPHCLASNLAEVREADGSRALWVGLDRGWACLRGGRWQVHVLPEGMPDDALGPMIAAPDGAGGQSLWAAPRKGGILNFVNGRFEHHGEAQGLPPGTAVALLSTRTADDRDWLWAAMPSGRLARLELGRKGARWRFFPLGALTELHAEAILRLEADRQGRMYVSTSSGILRFPLEMSEHGPIPGRIERYTTGDGLPTLTCCYGASLVDAMGRVWIGTYQGAVVLDPGQETQAAPPMAPAFDAAVILGRHGAVRAHQDLRYDENNLMFRFSLPVHHRRDDSLYRTQLAGMEGLPGAWTRESHKEFTALRPGSYTLRLWGMDYLGRVSGPVEFPFAVASPPWRRPWAVAAYLAILAGLWLLAVRIRVRMLRRRAEQLERMVEQRTKELEAAHQRTVRVEEEVRTLQGMLPICACCKKIRDDQGLWNQIESYISAHSTAVFSHGICPDCAREFYPDPGKPAEGGPEGKDA